MTDITTKRETGTEPVEIAQDIAYGAEAIAVMLGLTGRQVYRLSERARLPIFRIGGTICARRSTVMAWIEEQEQAARARMAAKDR